MTSLNNNGGNVRAYLISHTAWTEDLALRTEDVALDFDYEVTNGANMLVLGAAIATTLAALF